MKAQSRVLAGVCCLGATLIGSRVQAQEKVPEKVPVATVTKVEGVTEKSDGGGAWQKTDVGAGLVTGDRFRTGKGSKANLKFTDGSLLRLGQLSSIEIRDNRNVALYGGRVLFSALHPGRVLAGTAVAEITGSVGIVTLNRDGSSEFSLYSGAMDVITQRNAVSVPPGRSVTVRPDGTLSEIQLAKPIPEELK